MWGKSPKSGVMEQGEGNRHSFQSWYLFQNGWWQVRKAISHHCSQAALTRLATSTLNKDTLARISWLRTSCSFPNKVHLASKSFCIYWNILANQVVLLVEARGQSWGKEEVILFFTMYPKLLMDALPKSLLAHTCRNTWCDCMLMFLLMAMHYLLIRARD